MNIRELIKSWGMGILLVALLLWGTTLHAAVPAAWKDSGFSINASGMTLTGVLEDFSRTYGVRLSMSGEGDRLVKGRLKADNGIEFLNRLGATYKFRWFVYNNTLYVAAASDNTSERLAVGEDAVPDGKAALVDLKARQMVSLLSIGLGPDTAIWDRSHHHYRFRRVDRDIEIRTDDSPRSLQDREMK